MNETLNLQQLLKAIGETVYMTCVSLFFVCILGLMIGIILYITSDNGLVKNKWINTIANGIVNILRAIPFIILLILLWRK